MPLSVKGSVARLAGALPILISFSAALSPQHIARGPAAHEFQSQTTLGWIASVRPASRSCRQHGRHHRGSFGDERSMLPPARGLRPRTASARCRLKRPRTHPLYLAAVPAAAGDTRDLLKKQTTTPASITKGVESKSLEAAPVIGHDGVDEGAAICLRLGNTLSRDVKVAGQDVRLRLASVDDHVAIVEVRCDVFPPLHASVKHRYHERSFALMMKRRRRGAFCLVAALEGASTGGSDGEGTGADVEEQAVQHILGTLECSTEEFDGTPLEWEKGGSAGKIARLYVTEVAVRSDCRRLGVGSALLGLVDDVAKQLGTAEVLLHVFEMNDAALKLYTSLGYEDAPDTGPSRLFTNSLGLAGGTIGLRLRLLRKTFQSGDGAGLPSSSSAPAS